MSDPIEISKRYKDLGDSEDFVSYDRLAGGDTAAGEDQNRRDGGGGAPGSESQGRQGATSRAEEILREARQERDRILAEQEELKKKAYEEGFASGREEGRRQGRDEYTAGIESTTGLINELAAAREKLVGQYEDEILDLIKVMVERLVRQQIDQNRQVIQDVLHNALEYIVENTTVTVKLNRADIERLNGGTGEGELFLEERRRKVELVEDETISTGGCLVVTGSGEVDATLENRRDILFDAVDKALKDQSPEDSGQEAQDR